MPVGYPGSAGATPVQNVGAYGVEVGSILRRVRLLDRATGQDSWAGPEALGLGYRTSILKHTDAAVVLEVELDVRSDGSSAPLAYRELAVALGAEEGERRPAAQVRQHVLALRRSKGMVLDADDHDTWSAGSFFTNPVVPDDRLPQVLAAIAAKVGEDVRIPQFPADGGTKLSAGWLIERAGFAKGFPAADAPARCRRSTRWRSPTGERHRPRTSWRWRGRCATASRTLRGPSASRTRHRELRDLTDGPPVTSGCGPPPRSRGGSRSRAGCRRRARHCR